MYAAVEAISELHAKHSSLEEYEGFQLTLAHADLSHMHLRGSLASADLRDVNFTGAILDVDLSDADLTGTAGITAEPERD